MATIATLTWKSHASSAARAVASSAPVASMVRRTARRTSFALVGFKSTIRLPYTLFKRTITALEKVFSAIFCAVPALSRVLPEMISAPVSSVMPISASRCNRRVRIVGDADGQRAPAARGRSAPST